MSFLRYTLITDGTSDFVLKYPIEWAIEQLSAIDFEGYWADPLLQQTGGRDFRDRLESALDLYPCDLLFVHRDAEKNPRQERVAEIFDALRGLSSSPPAVCVVPVRMTEAWLLIDEFAFREAAGNPNGQVALDLPPRASLESMPNPKRALFDILRRASELSGRRLRRFREHQARHRLAESIADFAPLRELPAFRDFETELASVLDENGWL